MASKQPISQDLALAFGGLVFLSTAIIYAGSRASLKAPPKPKGPQKLIADGYDDSDDEDEDEAEYLEREIVIVYPLIASLTLLGLWGVIKVLGEDLVNTFASVIFGVAGIGAVHTTLAGSITWLLGRRLMAYVPKYSLMMTQGPREIFAFKFPFTSLLVLPVAWIPPIYYVFNEPFDFPKFALWGGILAVSFGFNAIRLVKIDTFRSGTYLLAGLLVYDVWWVYGTTVMVKVATSLNLPIKLLWPKNAQMARASDFVLLGLGDVVVPGLFVALALRYDQAKFLAKVPANRAHESFPKPYFTAAILAYSLGLALTMFIMQYTGHAQPALLYLSPACLLSFTLVGTARGELREAWNWTGDRKGVINVDALPEAKPIVSAPTPEIARAPSLQPRSRSAIATTGTGTEDDSANTGGESEAGSGRVTRQQTKKRRG